MMLSVPFFVCCGQFHKGRLARKACRTTTYDFRACISGIAKFLLPSMCLSMTFIGLCCLCRILFESPKASATFRLTRPKWGYFSLGEWILLKHAIKELGKLSFKLKYISNWDKNNIFIVTRLNRHLAVGAIGPYYLMHEINLHIIHFGTFTVCFSWTCLFVWQRDTVLNGWINPLISNLGAHSHTSCSHMFFC